MDRHSILERLAQAIRPVDEGQNNLACQRDIIIELVRAGVDAHAREKMGHVSGSQNPFEAEDHDQATVRTASGRHSQGRP
jgi:hypothetical protein